MTAASSEPLRVIVIGDSPVGLALQHLKHVGTTPAETVAGAFGKLSEADLTDTLNTEADVAIVCDDPRFDRIVATFRHLMLRKIPIVCDSGGMIWPWLKHPHLADVLAGEARRAGVAIAGVGNDPAAVQALLPALRQNQNVSRVVIRRHLDGRTRQIGYMRTAEQFRKLANEGIIGLAGTGEMAVLVAQALGRHPMRADIRTALRPTLDGHGKVIGLRQTSAWAGDELEIEVEHIVDVKAVANGDADTLEITSDTTQKMVLPENDLPAALSSIAERVRQMQPGLYTPLDLFNQ